MSITPDCGYLNAVQAKADEIFADGKYKDDLIADVISGQAFLEQQRGMVTIDTNTKNKELRVEWQTKCSIDTTDCTDDCTIDGEDISPECKDYEVECLQESTFKVPERLYRDRTIEKTEAVARNMLLHMNAMDVWVTQYILAQLVAMAGTNQFTGGIGNVVGTTTYIAPAYWDDGIWGYLNQVIRLNKFRQPYLLTGNNLYQLLFNRPLESGNAQGGNANMRKIGTLRTFQDPENIETVAAGQSILVHRGAAGFFSKVWNPANAINAVEPAPGEFLWSEPSRNLPGINYDLFMIKTCVGNEFYEAYKIQLSGVFASNPYPCDDDVTGVLVFECGTGA